MSTEDRLLPLLHIGSTYTYVHQSRTTRTLTEMIRKEERLHSLPVSLVGSLSVSYIKGWNFNIVLLVTIRREGESNNLVEGGYLLDSAQTPG